MPALIRCASPLRRRWRSRRPQKQNLFLTSTAGLLRELRVPTANARETVRHLGWKTWIENTKQFHQLARSSSKPVN